MYTFVLRLLLNKDIGAVQISQVAAARLKLDRTVKHTRKQCQLGLVGVNSQSLM